MYTHLGLARRGLGRLILRTCERAARDAGFTHAELLATLAGEPLYLAHGWHEFERTALATSIGVDVPAVRMGKRLVDGVSSDPHGIRTRWYIPPPTRNRSHMDDRHLGSFEAWLDAVRGLSAQTIGSRISSCERVEQYEGDLDSQFDNDGLASLLERLTYSAEDATYGRSPKHKVPINGNVRTGTATLKAAVTLYHDFRNSSELGLAAPPRTRPVRQRAAGRRTVSGSWPDWGQPTAETLHSLALALTPLVRFLEPEIVAAVAEDTRRHASEWSIRFRKCGIDPAIYLWDGSPCVFPGVRRHAGSKEIAEFRRQSPQDTLPPHCLALDDNDYPKHLWAFVFTGKPFRKKGPDGYQLGHLVDHKEYRNRWREELRVVGEDREPPLLFGLFTSAANTAYFPSAFLRPTDFSFHLRSLVQRRAQHLYGDVCRVLPPGLELKPGIHPSWEPEKFQWNPPVGETTHVPAFLEYRRGRIDELLRNRADALGSRSDAQNPDA